MQHTDEHFFLTRLKELRKAYVGRQPDGKESTVPLYNLYTSVHSRTLKDYLRVTAHTPMVVISKEAVDNMDAMDGRSVERYTYGGMHIGRALTIQ